jgi:hypothetical protein
MAKLTKKNFEDYLNSNSLAPPQGDSEWIIGGKIRMGFMWKRNYGSALRMHDPMQFDTKYNAQKRLENDNN